MTQPHNNHALSRVMSMHGDWVLVMATANASCKSNVQNAVSYRPHAHGVVPDLFTQFNENQHKPRLRTKTENFMRSEFFIVHIVFILTVVKTLRNDVVCS